MIHSSGQPRPNQYSPLRHNDAASIAHALGLAHLIDGGWTCRCPLAVEHTNADVHPSFTVSDASAGRVLIYCHSAHAGEQERLIDELRGRGLWPSSAKKKVRRASRRNSQWEFVR